MNKKHIITIILSSCMAVFAWGIVSVYSGQSQQGARANVKSAITSPSITLVGIEKTSQIIKQNNQSNKQTEDEKSSSSCVIQVSSSYMDIFPDLLTKSPGHEHDTASKQGTDPLEMEINSAQEIMPISIGSLDINGVSGEENSLVNDDKKVMDTSNAQEDSLTQTITSPIRDEHNPLEFLTGWTPQNSDDETGDSQLSSGVPSYQLPVSYPDGTFFYPTNSDYSYPDYSMMQIANNGNGEPVTGQTEQQSGDSDSIAQDQTGTDIATHLSKQARDKKHNVSESNNDNSSKLAMYEALRRQQGQDSDSASDSASSRSASSKEAQKALLDLMQKHNKKLSSSGNNDDGVLSLDDPVIDDSDEDDQADDSPDGNNGDNNAGASGDSDGVGQAAQSKEPSMLDRFKGMVKGVAGAAVPFVVPKVMGAGWNKFCDLFKKGDAQGDPAQQGGNNAPPSAVAQYSPAAAQGQS